MGMLGLSPHCTVCENRTHWIELMVVDEHNQPFDNVKGELIDAEGVRHPILLNHAPTVVSGLPSGFVTLELDPIGWLKQSQQRRPLINESESNPVDEWITQKPLGHNNGERARINVTAGDLLIGEQAQDLPKRHQAQSKLTGQLVTDKCHVLCVQGFNYITLRFGLFFDGTANNTYSAQWGKQQLEKYYLHWKSRKNLEGNKPVRDWQAETYQYPNQDDFYWFWEDDEKVASSAANELTNIQKLYERYITDKFNQDQTVFYHPEYITGIGTGNSTDIAKADESLKGQALGLGEYGVEAKVTTSIQNLNDHFDSVATTMRNLISTPIDGINKVELDVFGFSRGAAAARHFINVALDGEQGEFVPKFVEACQQTKLALQAGFDWSSNEHCEATFVGLFDTVAAIADFSSLDFTPHNQDNGDVRLWLDPQRVRHAVHLTASPKTEYRYNFSSNKLNPADNFHEIMVYGAHSDVGGGYYSQYAFDQTEYLLPLVERKRIKRIVRDCPRFDVNNVKQRIEQELQTSLEQEVVQGWNRDDYFISIEKGPRRGKNDQQQMIGELYLQRLVQGDLSRLYLRVMYGLAESMQVPLTEYQAGSSISVWVDPKQHKYKVPELISCTQNNPSMIFGKLCDSILQMSKQGNIGELTTYLSSSKFLDAFMRYSLIHHSSDDGIANHPNTNAQGAFDREQYDPTV
ncbi:T6SS phospholipase effector Tle1-like catalytic domain-containing protein [Vibrio litoralis]|uniref:T6SS phospholipase effector Tle1-like catalytic domain-containing protein n=1 Tax=Vibrio litoralis TaxID=335972 RepID=UPI0003FA2741|nr:DUF2235 domain-containing protein [Vibrio litoralis]